MDKILISNKTTNSIQPVVSLIVITYNSSDFVTETLNSIYNQDYKGRIELIITDDCSIDNTIDIVKNWVSNHSDRFIRTYIQTSLTNTGISENVNRGLKQANGKWIKFIAGDDALEIDYLSVMVNFVTENDLEIAYCNLTPYKQFFTKRNKIFIKQKLSYIKSKEITSLEQYKILLRFDPISSPSSIMSKQILTNVGGYENKYKYCDDWPLFIKMTLLGYKINYIDYNGIKYRKHNLSVQMKKRTEIISKFENTKFEVINDLCISHYSFIEKLCVNLYYKTKLNLSIKYNNIVPNRLIGLFLYSLDLLFKLENILWLKYYIYGVKEFSKYLKKCTFYRK